MRTSLRLSLALFFLAVMAGFAGLMGIANDLVLLTMVSFFTFVVMLGAALAVELRKKMS